MKGVCLVVSMLALWAVEAHAQEAPPQAPEALAGPSHPLTGRALVYLEAEAVVDEFVRVFLYEVIAGRLQDHGLVVQRGDASDLEPPAMACLAEPSCVADLQRTHTAPLVLAFHLAMADEGLVVTWRRSDAIAQAPLTIHDNEGGVAASLAQTLMELDTEQVPCVVVIESELRVTLSVDGAAVQSPGVVGPGDHRARAVATGREAWSGPLRCEGARVLRVGVR